MESHTEKILVIGAGGQLGSELTAALRENYGNAHVIASDIQRKESTPDDSGPFEILDVLNASQLADVVSRHRITQVYHLAAMLSAAGERNPALAWQVNMDGLLNVLEMAREKKLHSVFWPSSIAAFGPNTPKENTPQYTPMDPTTVYGISKQAGERWCEYYFMKYGVDVRSLRYPGLISYKTAPGGGTTDYAVEIYHQALATKKYVCFLSENTYLPMMYMPDAVKATLQLMAADAARIRVRSGYNVAAFSFSPGEIAAAIQTQIPDFRVQYAPDFRQAIADSWPRSIDDGYAREDWQWQPDFSLASMTSDMLLHLRKQRLPEIA